MTLPLPITGLDPWIVFALSWVLIALVFVLHKVKDHLVKDDTTGWDNR